MLSENVAMRGRIIELEKQVEDNESRRIADHALAIKSKMEAQLAEWGTMLSGLGLEPPPKRHSPAVRKSTNRRTSFAYSRVSPSQRRLRDMAREIDDLGHIPEYKQYPSRAERKTLKYVARDVVVRFMLTYCSPQEILAMRMSDSSTAGSPELGPPPMSQFIDDEPFKVDSPPAAPPLKERSESTPQRKFESSVLLPSPKPEDQTPESPSPKRDDLVTKQQKPEPAPQEPNAVPAEATVTTPTKAGTKRKLATREENVRPLKTDENKPARILAGKSIRDKTGGMSLKDLASMRKETREELTNPRKALSAKSTNDDMSSPKKTSKPAKPIAQDEMAAVKSDLVKSRRSKPKVPTTIKIEALPEPAATVSDLGAPLAAPELLMPMSPESVSAARGDTPPPADISSRGEAARPSRRNRTAVSYAEPNLRDKMRRPGKELVDAVVNRRSSQFEPVLRESTSAEAESIPASPLSGKNDDIHASVVTERRRRQSTAVSKLSYAERDSSIDESTLQDDESVDLYEIATSPRLKPLDGKKKTAKGRSRRFSAAVESDDGSKEGPSTRRRSMMV